MNEIPEPDFAERRRRLAAEIARQRTEFAQAYARLEQPIRYTEYGMRGFGFLRNNPWILVAAPAVLSLAKIVWGDRKKKPSPPASIQPAASDKDLTGFKKTAFTLAGYIWRLYQLYRRARPYFL